MFYLNSKGGFTHCTISPGKKLGEMKTVAVAWDGGTNVWYATPGALVSEEGTSKLVPDSHLEDVTREEFAEILSELGITEETE